MKRNRKTFSMVRFDWMDLVHGGPTGDVCFRHAQPATLRQNVRFTRHYSANSSQVSFGVTVPDWPFCDDCRQRRRRRIRITCIIVSVLVLPLAALTLAFRDAGWVTIPFGLVFLAPLLRMRSWAMEVSYLMYDNGDVIVFTHPDHPRVPSPPKNGRPRKNQSQKDQGERSQDSDGGSGSSR